MKTIRITHPHSLNKSEIPPAVLALGYFDGLHLGHQKVVKTAKKVAEEKGLACSVMTFDPHPSVILRKDVQHVEYITPLPEKEALFEELGIDYLFIVSFSKEFASLFPQEFVDNYIIGLNVQHVVAGFDFTYGRLGKGTMETLPFHSREEFTQTTVEKLTNNNEKISSTLIRDLIRQGEVSKLPNLLGRFYTINGVVVDGDKRGRTIGFPTANVQARSEFIIPKMGVYAVRLKVHSKWYNGVCNVGIKPTFQEERKTPSIEVHLLNFDQDIYQQSVTVEWHKRIRSEQKFPSIQELIEQIGIDKQQAEEYFEKLYEHT